MATWRFYTCSLPNGHVLVQQTHSIEFERRFLPPEAFVIYRDAVLGIFIPFLLVLRL
jgi:hypothetical protein